MLLLLLLLLKLLLLVLHLVLLDHLLLHGAKTGRLLNLRLLRDDSHIDILLMGSDYLRLLLL